MDTDWKLPPCAGLGNWNAGKFTGKPKLGTVEEEY